MDLTECDEEIIDKTLTAATNVHRQLGPGLLESVYEKALLIECSKAGLKVASQVDVPVMYDGQNLGLGFRADIVVNDSLILEIKSVDKLTDIHMAQLINYLKLLGLKRGFLINFNQRLLKYGIKRVSI